MVLSLANQLREHGVDAALDQYEARPSQGWPHWCELQLRPDQSDFVLMICTSTYRDRIENRVPADEGRGVFWEGALIYQYIYDAKSTDRYIPVLLTDSDETAVPVRLKEAPRYRIDAFEFTDLGYASLYRVLTHQSPLKPPLGTVVALPSFESALPERAVQTPFGGGIPTDADWLELREQRWHARLSPAALLRADYEIVPFHGRDTEMRSLLAWARDEELVGVWLLTGPGGMGKSRLALELCRRVRADGFEVGALRRERFDELVAYLRNGADETTRLFIVVDYAEQEGPMLEPLFAALRDLQIGRVRLLMLARRAKQWWGKLKRAGDGVGDFVTGPQVKKTSLGPLTISMAERADSYWLAANSFAERLNCPAPTTEPPFDSSDFDTALFLHMKALLDIGALSTLEEDSVKGQPTRPEDILDGILHREHRFWSRLWAARELDETLDEALEIAAAALFLSNGAESRATAVKTLRKVPELSDLPSATLTSVAELFNEAYPGSNLGRWIERLQPDRLGEHLVSKVVRQYGADMVDKLLSRSE
jgi:hypothetical protein